MRRVTLLALFLLCLSVKLAAKTPEKSYSYTLQKNDTASFIAQLYTGDAQNWQQNGFTVISRATGTAYLKTPRQMRRLQVGDSIIIDTGLVKTQPLFLGNAQTAEEICQKIKGSFCLERVARINGEHLNQKFVGKISVPAWFDIKAFGNPPRPSPTLRPITPPAGPRDYTWLYTILLGVVLATIVLLLYLTVILPNQRRRGQFSIPEFYRDTQSSILARLKARRIRQDLRLSRQYSCQVTTQGGKILVYCPEDKESLVAGIIKQAIGSTSTPPPTALNAKLFRLP